MSSIADVWNMALSLIGQGDEISDPDSETSKEAAACRRFWEPVRDQTLRDFPWPRLRMTEALALVQDFTNVAGAEWVYSYRMPAKCAAVRRLLNPYTRIDTSATVVNYNIGRDSSGELIFTDLEGASVEYTYLETQVGRYTADVVSAMAHLLAAHIAPRFGPDAVKLGDRALRIYEWRRGTAQANALNEVQRDITDDSSFLSARG